LSRFQEGQRECIDEPSCAFGPERKQRCPADEVSRVVTFTRSLWRTVSISATRRDPFVSNSASVDQCQSRCIKPSRPDGGLVCMALKSPANGRDRSIATESRCPHDVRSSLNFRHNVAASRASIWAITRHPAGSHRLKVWRVNAGGCSIDSRLSMRRIFFGLPELH
jgi:hypothetical protein